MVYDSARNLTPPTPTYLWERNVEQATVKILQLVLASISHIIAPQAQLFETGKDRRVKTKALFKQVVKFKQIDPLRTILGENKGGPYCLKSEIT